MALSSESLAGPGYIILNGIRVLNIIGLLAVIAASVVMLIKTTTNSSLFFFDALTNVVTAFFSSFLLISELSLFKSYFARSVPLLSPSHGFVTLALAMSILGIDLLAKLNHETDSQKQLGLAFWRIVIGAGIISFILGFVNLVASFVFRDRRRGITARQVRAHGAVAGHMTPDSKLTPIKTPASEARTPRTPEQQSPSLARNPLRLITDPLHAMHPRRGSTVTVRPDPILPSYHASTTPNANDDPSSPSSKYSRATVCSKKNPFSGFPFGRKNRESVVPPVPGRPMEISAPMGSNPQFAHLVRPESSMHPARANEREAFRWNVNRGE